MRILFVSQYYAPEPVPKIPFLARSLAARGHAVTVLTGLPCYPEGRIHESYKGRSYMRETIDGVEVLRVPQFADHSSSAMRRILYYFSFPFFAFFRLFPLLSRRFDVAYFYSAAIPLLFLAPMVRLMFRCPVVYDLADLWPESVESTGMIRSPFLLKLVSALSTFLYKRADHLGVLTNGYKERLVSRGVPPERMTVTYYCVPDQQPGADSAIPLPSPLGDGRFTVTYTGMIGPVQNLGTVLDAAKLLAKTAPNVRIVLAGSGVEQEPLVQRIQSEAILNVSYLGRLPMNQMPGIYAASDVLFVHLKPDCLSTVSIPSKTFSYMAAGKPILMAVDGEAGQFVEAHQCGLYSPAGDAASFADAVVRLSQMPREQRETMGQRARDLYDTRFSGPVQVSIWEDLLSAAAQRPGSSHATEQGNAPQSKPIR